MVMEFSFINVNLNIDRKLFIFMCAGLMLTVVLSDESNPVVNVLRAIPPISILDRYVIPVIKTAAGYFRGYGTMYGNIGAKVPIKADNFVPSGDPRDADAGKSSNFHGERGLHNGDGQVVERSKPDGLMIDEEEALSFSKGQRFEGFDEESMPKSDYEITKETAEDAHERAKYTDGEHTFKTGKRKFKIKR